MDHLMTKLTESKARLQRVIDGSDQGFWEWDIRANHFLVSERFETMLGYTPGECVFSQENWAQFVHPDDLAKAQESINQHLEGKTLFHEIELRCRTKNSTWKYILTHGKVVVRAENGDPLIMSGTHTDITKQKQIEQRLQKQAALLDLAYDAIIVCNMNAQITFWNRGAEATYGWSWDEVKQKDIHQLLHTQFSQPLTDIEDNLLRSGQWDGVLTHTTKLGVPIVVTSRWAVKRENNIPVSIMEINRDISGQYALLQKLELQARQDHLTGLNNRGYFMELAEHELNKALRYDHHFTLLMLDIDHFKKINDSFGHKTGDLVLKKFAEIFRETLRDGDIVGRIGGEEFVVLLPETNVDTAVIVAERIRTTVEQTVIPVNDEVSVCFTVSIGGSEPTFKGCTIDTLLAQADHALYLAKNDGRNRLCIGFSCRTYKD